MEGTCTDETCFIHSANTNQPAPGAGRIQRDSPDLAGGAFWKVQAPLCSEKGAGYPSGPSAVPAPPQAAIHMPLGPDLFQAAPPPGSPPDITLLSCLISPPRHHPWEKRAQGEDISDPGSSPRSLQPSTFTVLSAASEPLQVLVSLPSASLLPQWRQRSWRGSSQEG